MYNIIATIFGFNKNELVNVFIWGMEHYALIAVWQNIDKFTIIYMIKKPKREDINEK